MASTSSSSVTPLSFPYCRWKVSCSAFPPATSAATGEHHEVECRWAPLEEPAQRRVDAIRGDRVVVVEHHDRGLRTGDELADEAGDDIALHVGTRRLEPPATRARRVPAIVLCVQ
jgi:hypothetical protein